MNEVRTSPQIDLLGAAFLRGRGAVGAWESWRDGVDWDGHLDHASFALLPLVYRNLARLGVQDPLMPRLKGVMRRAWLANQRWIARIEPSLAACARDGIEVLVLPPTLRLLLDSSAVMSAQERLSLAVRPGQAEPAVRCLLRAGWRMPEVSLPRWSLTGYIVGARHLMLQEAQGQPLMLTWGLEWWLADRVGEVWTGARHELLGRQPVRRLDSADALEFELRHPVGDPPLRRIAEILMIAQHGEPDWGRLAQAVRERPLPPDWSAALALMQPFLDQWGAPPDLPRWCGPPSPARAAPRASLLRRSRYDWRAYRAALGSRHGLAAALIQLPGYLMGRWHVPGPGGLPRRLLGWIDPALQPGRSTRR